MSGPMPLLAFNSTSPLIRLYSTGPCTAYKKSVVISPGPHARYSAQGIEDINRLRLY